MGQFHGDAESGGGGIITMKRLVFLILICLTLVGFVQASYLDTYNSNLSGLLHFNQTPFVEETGQTVTNTGSVAYNTTTKNFGTGSSFYSSNYLSVPHTSGYALGTNNFTVSLWAYPTQNTSLSIAFSIGDRSAGSSGLQCGISAGNWVCYGGTASGNDIINGISFGKAYTESWQQVVVERAGNTFTGYVNGTGTTLATSSSSLYDDGTAPRIGNSHYPDNFYFYGNIDEFAVWNGVAVPISSLYPQTQEIDSGGAIAPVSTFTTTKNSVNGNTSVIFTDTSTNVPTFWNWEFTNTTGNNTQVVFSTIQNPVHNFGAGNFSVVLNSSNAAGFNISQPTWVNVTYVSANFTGTPLTGESPLSVVFTDESIGTIANRSWFFGDEPYSQPWLNKTNTTNVPWVGRMQHSIVSLPNGHLVMFGGWNVASPGVQINYNDTWMSSDGGVTWILQSLHAPWVAREDMATTVLPDNSIVFLGGCQNGVANGWYSDVWRTTDEGVTWTMQNAGAPWGIGEGGGLTTLSNGVMVFAGGYTLSSTISNNFVYNSSDKGVTWSLVNNSAAWSKRDGFTLNTLPDDSIILIGGSYWTDSTAYTTMYNDVWRSTDGGNIWILQNASSDWLPRTHNSAVVMPDGSIVMGNGYNLTGFFPSAVGGNFNDVWRSSDKGVTWDLLTANAEWSPRSGTWFNLMPDGSVKMIGGISFTNSGIGTNFNDTWSFSPQGSNDINPSHVYTGGGLYNVSEMISDTNFFSTLTKSNYIAVSGETSSLSSSFTSNVTLGHQSPMPVSFTDASTGSPTTWNWTFGDENVSTLQNPVYTYTVPGNYTVLLNVTNSTGSFSNSIGYVNLSLIDPVVSFSVDNTTPVTTQTVTFADLSTGSPNAWNWSFGDGIYSDLQNPTHVYLTTGLKTVSLFAYQIGYPYSNGTTVMSNYINVSAATPALPTASFTTNTTGGVAPLAVLFTDTSTGPTPFTYYWDFGDLTNSISGTVSHLYSSNGVYDVNLSVTNLNGTAYANKTITVAAASGFNRVDLQMTQRAILTIVFKDSATNDIIPVVTVVDSNGYTETTVNGIYTHTYDYGTVILYFASAGYRSKSASYLISADRSETVLLVPNTASTSTTWYTPRTVAFSIVDVYGNKLSGATMNAHYNSTTLPNGISDLINNYGMNDNAANDALNGTLIMSGVSDSMGVVVFTMMSTIKYDITVSYGGNTNTYSFYPQQANYQLKFIVAASADNIWSDLYANGNTKVWATEPDIGNVTFWWSFQDMTALTTRIDFYLKDMDLNTTVYTTNVVSPIAGGIYQLNYTVPNVRGKNYMAWENYTRGV